MKILYGTPDLTPEEEQQLMLQAQQTELKTLLLMEAMANGNRQCHKQPSQLPQVQQTSQPAQPTGS
jgi:hypothetical protein